MFKLRKRISVLFQKSLITIASTILHKWQEPPAQNLEEW